MNEAEDGTFASRERKFWITIVCILTLILLVILVISLDGQEAKHSPATEEPQATSAYDADLLNISVPEGWQYSSRQDQIRGEIEYVDLASENSILLIESEGTRLFLQLARTKGGSTSAFFYLDPGGNFGCSGVCPLPVSIDGQRDTIGGYSRGALDPPSEVFNVYDGEDLARKLRTATRLIVEVQIAEHGTEQFQFDVQGLVWPALSLPSLGGSEATGGTDQNERWPGSLPNQLWMGSVGGAGDNKCSLTSSGSVKTTPYIFIENGQATLLSESSDVVILSGARVDNGAEVKMIFATSQTLCEEARKQT